MARNDGETWLRDRPVGRTAFVDRSDAADVWRVGGAVALGVLAGVLSDQGMVGMARWTAVAIAVLVAVEWLLGPRIGIPRMVGARRVGAGLIVLAAFVVATYYVDGEVLLPVICMVPAALALPDLARWAWGKRKAAA